MNTKEISAALDESDMLPRGRLKVERLELLALEARTAGDRGLEGEVLLNLIEAYLYGGERDRMPVACARLLKIFDEHPGEVGRLSHEIHWTLKWMTSNLVHNPAVPLSTVYRWLDEMESRYRQRAYSIRPVLQLRSGLARDLGDQESAAAAMETAIGSPRDEMADCEACEHNDLGTWRVWVGDDAGALEFWAPIIDGETRCAEEPHRVLAKALVPMVRTGRIEAARSAHLRGYPLVRRNVSLRRSVAHHIEFCALTGNEARGLEILVEHVGWLTDPYEDFSQRLGFLGGVIVLLRRLVALGHGELRVGDRSVDATRTALEEEITELAARHDARNGTTAVSERVWRRLGQQPLLDRLPLGAPTVLRRPESADASGGPAFTETAFSGLVTPGPAAGTTGPAAGTTPDGLDLPYEGDALDRLVAEARRFSALVHPDAAKVWNRVAGWSSDLPEPVATEVALSRAADLIESDPAAAHDALLAVADRFTALGDPGSALQTRAVAIRAAVEAAAGARDTTAAGEPDLTAVEAQARALVVEAEAGFAAGDLTPSGYLAVHRVAALLAVYVVQRREEPSEAEIQAVHTLLEAELALAEELAGGPAAEHAAGDQRQDAERPERSLHAHVAVLYERSAQLCFLTGDLAAARDRLTGAVMRFVQAGERWRAAGPSAALAQLALNQDDAPQAEGHARRALELGEGLVCADLMASMGSLLVEAIVQQPDRELDVVDAALTAAARWEGIAEPDMLHNTFTAARAYHRLERYAEAAALFEQAMPQVEIPYDAPVVAMTRQQYGDALSELGRFREAAEQYLKAARLVQDDPSNQVAHAQLAWSGAEALRDAGEMEQAVSAFRRAADLWAELGALTPSVRCRRSAAWLLAWLEDQAAESRPEGTEPAGAAEMREVLTELEAAAAKNSLPGSSGESAAEMAEEIAAELAETRSQLEQLLAAYAGPDTRGCH